MERSTPKKAYPIKNEIDETAVKSGSEKKLDERINFLTQVGSPINKEALACLSAEQIKEVLDFFYWGGTSIKDNNSSGEPSKTPEKIKWNAVMVNYINKMPLPTKEDTAKLNKMFDEKITVSKYKTLNNNKDRNDKGRIDRWKDALLKN